MANTIDPGRASDTQLATTLFGGFRAGNWVGKGLGQEVRQGRAEGGPVPTQYKATQLVVALAVWATQRSDPDFTEAIPTLLLPVVTYLAYHWTITTLLS